MRDSFISHNSLTSLFIVQVISSFIHGSGSAYIDESRRCRPHSWAFLDRDHVSVIPSSTTMIDQILGRPSSTVRRTEVFLVLFFWIWRLYKGDGSAINSAARSRRRRVTSAYNVKSVITRSPAWWRRLWLALIARGPGARWTTRVNERLSGYGGEEDMLTFHRILYALSARYRHVHRTVCLPASGRSVGYSW